MKSGYIAVDVTVVSQYALIFFSVTSKYSIDEPMIYKLSEFKKIQVMKNKHVLLNKGNNKITELRTILQRESQNS